MQLVILPVLLPLLGGIVLLFAKNSSAYTKRVITLIFLGTLLATSILLLYHSIELDYITYQLGNWDAPYGITLVADRLSASMLLTTSLLSIGAMLYSIARDIDIQGHHFHILFLLQIFGINGAFLTGDIFNLFVFFEILLIASYSLLLHGGGKKRVRAGLHYVVLNLIGSALFLFAVGTLYALLGTLNIADLALAIRDTSSDNYTLIALSGLMLLFVFGLKAAMFPLYLWLPEAYSRTSAPVAALFAIMTKVGLYSIIRVHGTIFGDLAGELSYYYTPWLVNLGVITIVLSTFGAMRANELKKLVAYLVIVSVSILLIAIGINTQASLAGGIYYMIHSTFIVGAFFLLADIIANQRGAFEDRITKAPSFNNAIFIGSLFFIVSLSTAGLPPFSGFIGKVMVLSSAIGYIQQGVVMSAIIISSILVVITLARAGTQIFYDTDKDVEPYPKSTATLSYLSVAFLFSFSILMVIFAKPIDGFANTTATLLLDSKLYVDSVLGSLEGIR
ncbi:MAG: monovalent cation/H+ antiporter subunit D [Campylobacterales bacterium]